jgi:hypothetical protein
MNTQQFSTLLHVMTAWAWLIFAAFAVVTALVLFVAFWEYTASVHKAREPEKLSTVSDETHMRGAWVHGYYAKHQPSLVEGYCTCGWRDTGFVGYRLTDHIYAATQLDALNASRPQA